MRECPGEEWVCSAGTQAQANIAAELRVRHPVSEAV
jgi:hypothetical protein